MECLQRVYLTKIISIKQQCGSLDTFPFLVQICIFLHLSLIVQSQINFLIRLINNTNTIEKFIFWLDLDGQRQNVSISTVNVNGEEITFV